MLARDLNELPVGTPLLWIVGEGASEVRHPARLLAHQPTDQVTLLVKFIGQPQERRRWSLLTNQPVGTLGHIGSIRLEIDRAGD